MAYDPNDPADKIIFDAAVLEALEEAATAHAAEVDRLTKKNKELLGKLAKARSGEGSEGSGAEIDRLERELTETQTSLETAQSEARQLKRDKEKAEKDRDTFKASSEKEAKAASEMVRDTALTDALVKANVAPELMTGARAMLASDVIVKEVDGKRNAFVGDKSVADYVTEWAASDAGKHYVKAPANGGGNNGNAPPANGGGAKKISEMTMAERNAYHNSIGAEAFTAQLERERANK